MTHSFKEYLVAFRPTIESNIAEVLSQRDQYLKEEGPEFHDEINTQFYERMKDEVALELATNFETATPEDIAMFMETFDIKGWMGK